jgi:hypothetical protein
MRMGSLKIISFTHIGAYVRQVLTIEVVGLCRKRAAKVTAGDLHAEQAVNHEIAHIEKQLKDLLGNKEKKQ